MVSLTALAARNNAAWCDVVCRAHGLAPELDEVAWTCRARAPRLYPDAVTLVPDASPDAVLGRIDTSAGCSVKDSFASLDLAPFGFRVLFDAEWIVLTLEKPGAVRTRPCWQIVADTDAFERWEQAWRPDGCADVLTPDLLGIPAVDVLGAIVDDQVVGGAVLMRTGGVVGISNFFAKAQMAAESWGTCLTFVAKLHPGATLVGYESGEMLDAARAQGFSTAGRLRVWTRDLTRALDDLVREDTCAR